MACLMRLCNGEFRPEESWDCEDFQPAVEAVNPEYASVQNLAATERSWVGGQLEPGAQAQFL